MVHKVDTEIRAYKVDVFVCLSSDVNIELCWWNLLWQFGSVRHFVLAFFDGTLDLGIIVFSQLANVKSP
jgi:hypothetical protein